MTVSLAKPATSSSEIVSGSISSTGSPTIAIKVQNVGLQFAVQVADTTGANDTTAVFEHNGLTMGAFDLQGYALGDQAIGLHNLQSLTANNGNLPGGTDNDGNQLPDPATLTLTFGSGRTITGKIVIERVALQYARSSPYAALNISGRFTSTNFGSVNVES